jgi:hypothetical protein
MLSNWSFLSSSDWTLNSARGYGGVYGTAKQEGPA